MIVERRRKSSFRLARFLFRDRRHIPIGAFRLLAFLGFTVLILICWIVISASDSPFHLVLQIGG